MRMSPAPVVTKFNGADCIEEDFCSDGLANEHRLHIEVYADHLRHIVHTTSMRIETSSIDVDVCTRFAEQG